jgi:hypothetical protein
MFAHPIRQEGRIASRHERGWGAVDAGSIRRKSLRSANDANADDEIVWSWRPWAGVKSARHEPAGDGDYEVTDTGESTNISVKTTAQGMSMLRLYLW